MANPIRKDFENMFDNFKAKSRSTTKKQREEFWKWIDKEYDTDATGLTWEDIREVEMQEYFNTKIKPRLIVDAEYDIMFWRN